jgi:hypothetical protein
MGYGVCKITYLIGEMGRCTAAAQHARFGAS